MDDGTPALEVGFGIDTAGAFGSLIGLDGKIDETVANAVQEFARVEAATKGAVNLAGATAQVTSFGNAATRELAAAARASANAERAGEAMVRQLQRQTETFGKTASEIRNMRAEQRALNAEQRGLTELAGRIRELNAEMNRLEAASGGTTNSLHDQATASGAAKAGYQQLNFQLSDIATQYSLGAKPMQIFAAQSGQLFQALGMIAQGGAQAGKGAQAAADAAKDAGADVEGLGEQAAAVAEKAEGMGGKLGAVATFMTGPWGAAVLIGVSVLTPFVAKLFEGNRALDDAVDKLKKDAEATEISRQANERFRTTAEGVAAAIRDGTEATKAAIAAQRTSAEQANSNAQANLAQEIAIRRATLAEIERVKTLAENVTPSGPGGADSAARIIYLQRVAELQKQAKEQADLIQQAEARLGQTRIDLATDAAKRATDATLRINRQYDAEAARLQAVARAEGTVTIARANRLANELAANERARKAALDAEQDKQQAVKKTAQVGREVDLAEARRIAQSIGARITSEKRSYAEQKALYDKYVAYKAGRGPWAALAAAPGTSDHERGNALDIAKTPGMSLGKIREAFRAAGVSIKQLLDEGSHFHVSWKKGADSAAAASKKLADVQADLAKKFDPAEAAAIEYRAALKSIADAKLDPATAKRYAEEAAEAFRKARAAAFELPSMAGIAAQADSDKASEKSAEDFRRNVLQPLKDEIALHGLVGAARETAALALERESFLAANMDQGITIAMQRWQEYYALKKQLIDKDAAADAQEIAIRRATDRLDEMVESARRVGDALSRSFGRGGAAIADAVDALGFYMQQQDELKRRNLGEAKTARESARLQVGLYGDMAEAAKGFFGEKSKGYQAMLAAEKVFRAFEFAMSVRAMVQDVAETLSSVANSGARATAAGAEGIATQSKLPFPFNIAAMAATGAALVAAGIALLGSGGGAGSKPAPTNSGTGTVFGDPSAKSESIKNSIDALKDVDTLTNTYARQMASSLRSIENQIGGIANLVVRAGDISASAGVTEGFKTNLIGSVLSKIPLIGGILGGLFGSTTTVTGSGLYAGAQSLGGILNGGFDASYYSDITKKSKFLGITTGTKNSTQYSAADGALETQFTLLLRQFNDAIVAAAGPLGAATADIQNRLNSFVVNIGKIDLKGLTGQEIQEKLSAVFGAAADSMANAAFPGIAQFQKVGEGAFETLVRVASTIEAVGNSLDMLGQSAVGMGVAAKLGLVDQFESISALTDAAEAYFQAYYTDAEQAAAKTAQLSRVFTSMGLAMPSTLAGFRQLVEAQDLTTAAGQEIYATLLKLAPAFADLKEAMEGAKSAADIASERSDLERQMLELQGNTAALRAMQLAKLDDSNRELQQQIWNLQDAQEAARAAEELRQAWTSVGDGIMDEVKRIRGLSGVNTEGGFASLMGQFNAATAAARAGDQDAAKSLPQLSQALLSAAADAATSRQELARIQAQTAASLEATYGVIGQLGTTAAATSTAALLAAAGATQTPSAAGNDNTTSGLLAAIDELREEVAQLRAENNVGHAANASANNRTAKVLENVTQQSGGDALSTVQAA
jgi:LAS superfamily LD-carboxypeptidase LdcB